MWSPTWISIYQISPTGRNSQENSSPKEKGKYHIGWSASLRNSEDSTAN